MSCTLVIVRLPPIFAVTWLALAVAPVMVVLPPLVIVRVLLGFEVVPVPAPI